MSTDTGLGVAAFVVLPLLVAIAVTASRFAQLRHDKGIVTAAVRAVLQLALVGAVVGFALQTIWGALAFIGVMLTVATITSSRRIRSTVRVPGQFAFCAFAIGGSAC